MSISSLDWSKVSEDYGCLGKTKNSADIKIRAVNLFRFLSL